MKTNIIFKGIASLAVAALLGSCSSDYLDVKPITSLSASTVQNTEEGAQAAAYGMFRAMYTQYSNYADYLFPNGEPWIQMFYGDIFGEDYFNYLFGNSMGSNFTWANSVNQQSWLPAIAWSYCYNLINQANNILVGIDDIEGDRDHLDFIKAQALTIRAHAYVRLLQIYGPRWADSNNGGKYTVVMRTTPGVENVPLSTMNDVLQLIYDDLDEAIEKFENTATQRHYIWEADEDVARGVYARAALLKNDYATAQVMAKGSRKYYPIMSATEYKGGFAEVNDEYIWANAPEVEGIYYFAHGSLFACQGPYPTLWGLSAGQINYELYKKIPQGDIRAELFFTPDKPLRGGLSKAAFWNENIVDPANMDLTALNTNMASSVSAFGLTVIPGGDKAKWGEPYVAKQSGEGAASHIIIPFGAQYKFWGLDGFGTNSFPFMRGAEMLLTEAEAAWHNNDFNTAKACLIELNAKRNPNYTCNLSGNALLEEIKLQRRIELWGEGFNWFDLKRWGDDMTRNVWEQRNQNSNNIPAQFKLHKVPSDMNGWRYAVPQKETQYNEAVDRSLLQ